MASWTNIPTYQPGWQVTASTVDVILDNITVLAGHNHSGSAGDGNAALSSCAIFPNAGILIRYNRSMYIPHFLPASNVGWSLRVIPDDAIGAPQGFSDSAYLATDSLSASGACVAYVIYIGSSAVPNGSNLQINMYMRRGPDAGTACFLIEMSGQVSNSTDFYSSTSGYANTSWQISNYLTGSYVLRAKVISKNVSSTGYGASITGLILRFN